ncbi:MAG: metallophosphoesterase [Bacteroidota bacterium]
MKRPFFRRFRKVSILLSFLLFTASIQAQDTYTVYLIGDAGEHTEPGKALLSLKKELEANPGSTVVFLGDNVYPKGVYPEGETARADNPKLHAQMEMVRQFKGNAIFIPGNHDWKKGKRGGYKQILRQADTVNFNLGQYQLSNKANGIPDYFYPKSALPGPDAFDLTDNLKLVILDSEWFLHDILFHRIGKNEGESKKSTERKFFADLHRILEEAAGKNQSVLVAGHHPLMSVGGHGKAKGLPRFLVNYTPFQVFGLIGLNRYFVQDIPQPRYLNYRNRMLEAFEKYYFEKGGKNLVYAAGHEHNLQHWKKEGFNHIVSGSGSKSSHFHKEALDHRWNQYAKLEWPVFEGEEELEAYTGYFKVTFKAGERPIVERFDIEIVEH